MTDDKKLISAAFQAFAEETPKHAKAWMDAVRALGSACALDGKTRELAYLAVLAALGRTSGVPFHAKAAAAAGASKEEILSAILVGLPAAGHGVTQSLPGAIDALEHESPKNLQDGISA